MGDPIAGVHEHTDPYCGAVGPIAFRDGMAWSVNGYRDQVIDWRFTLDELRHGCKACLRFIEAAKKGESRA